MRRAGPIPGKRETSRDAAESMRSASAIQRQEVLAFIQRAGSYGVTREEISRGLGIKIQSVTPRVLELLGTEVKETDDRRPTYSGRMAKVLVAIAPKPTPTKYVQRMLL